MSATTSPARPTSGPTPSSPDPDPARLRSLTLAEPGPQRVGFIAAALVAFVVLAGYAALTPFAFPATDDWFTARTVREQGLFNSVASSWMNMGGRWASSLAYGSIGLVPDLPQNYWLVVLLVQTLLWSGSWMLARLVCASRMDAVLAATVLSAVLIVAQPILNIGNLGWIPCSNESLYWAGGTLSYSIAWPLLALMTVIMVRAPLTWGSALLVTPLALFTTGLSEIAAMGAILVGLAGGLLGRRLGWVVLGAALVGFGISAAAPGNLKRLEMLRTSVDQQAGLSKLSTSVGTTAIWMIRLLRDWAGQPAVLGAVLVVGALGAGRCGTHRRWTLLVVLWAVPLTAYLLSLPTMTMVGFLESRHAGLVSFISVGMALAMAWTAGALVPAVGANGRMVVALVAIGLMSFAAWIDPLRGSGWGVRSLCLAAGGAVGMLVWGSGRIWGAWLMIVVGLAFSSQVWQLPGDLVKAQTLRAAQEQREIQVNAAIGMGFKELALPYLGRREMLPSTLHLFELQPGWMADGYRIWHRLDRVVLADIPQVMRLAPQPPPATAPATAP